MPYQRRHNRWSEIREILADLKKLEDDPRYRSAVNLNAEFFRAARTFPSYLWWLLFRAPDLRRRRKEIVELLDMPFARWQKSVLESLSWFEVWLGALKCIRNHIIGELDRLQRTKKEPIVVASFGCGGMELERQICYQLLRKRFNFPLVFIGIDYSASSFEVARDKLDNLISRGLVEIKTVSRLDVEELAALKASADPERFLLVFLETDAFSLQSLPENSFDLVYHTRLRHHLTPEERHDLDTLTVHLAPHVVELDDVSTVAGIIISSIFIWRFPAVLNGAVLSYLRDLSHEEIVSNREEGWNVVFSGGPLRSYLRLHDKASRPAPTATGQTVQCQM